MVPDNRLVLKVREVNFTKLTTFAGRDPTNELAARLREIISESIRVGIEPPSRLLFSARRDNRNKFSKVDGIDPVMEF